MPPSILSPEFHLRFLPTVLWRRLGRKKEGRTGFSSHLEFMIGLGFCIFLIALGMPKALKPGSIVGWIVAVLGMAGILALAIISIRNQWCTRPSYDEFLPGAFFFFIFLGLTAGFIFGETVGKWLIVVGMILGYLLGIAAGVAFQYLGWLSIILDVLFWIAVVLMMSADLVFLIR
jgi:hypothetical protein